MSEAAGKPAASVVGTIKERPGKGWVTKAEALELQDVAENTWERTYRGLLPADGTQEFGGRLWIYYPAFIEAFGAHKVRIATKRDIDDPMVGDRDALARTQRAKAEQEELKLGVMKGNLVDREQMKMSLASLTSALRRGIESLGRLFGSEAAAIMTEAVDEWVAGLEKVFGGGSQ